MKELPIPMLMLLKSETSLVHHYYDKWRQRLMVREARKTYVGDSQVIVKNSRILCFDEEVWCLVRIPISSKGGVEI